MWRSATTTEPQGRLLLKAGAVVVAALALFFPAAGVRAEVLMTQKEALEEAFPDAEFSRRTSFLTKGELDRTERLAGSRPETAVIVSYEARREGELLGTAYFDVHRVRTLREALMIVVDPDGKAARVEVLAFREPPDYLAPDRWLDQFAGQELDDQLRVKREIHGITGATLTARAVTKAVRRTLAIHQVLARDSSEPSEDRGREEEDEQREE